MPPRSECSPQEPQSCAGWMIAAVYPCSQHSLQNRCSEPESSESFNRDRVTSEDRLVTNRRRASRLVVPALVATFCVSAASACAGGVMTAAQMVCCVHEHHECEMTMDGDSCCTGEFHSSQQFVHAPKAKFHVDVVTLIAACPPAGSMALPTAATFFLDSESQLRAALPGVRGGARRSGKPIRNSRAARHQVREPTGSTGRRAQRVRGDGARPGWSTHW